MRVGSWLTVDRHGLRPRDDRVSYARAPLGSFGPAPPRAKTPLASPFFVALSVILPSMAMSLREGFY
jgi:hypothetical protein